MTDNRKRAIALGLGMAGLVGLALAAGAQVGGSALQQYEQKLKTLDKNKPDDVYALAKWCYQGGLTGEAQALALEANQKAPDDVRPKYLLYAIAAGSGASEIPTQEEEARMQEATISDTEVDKIFKDEGEPAMRKFREVQGSLIARCASLKCHGGGNPQSKWSLIRKNLGNRKTITENFRTINRNVNRGEDAPKSPLLLKPLSGSEAGHPVVAFRGSTNDPVYKSILSWIQSLKTATTDIWGKAATAPLPPAPAPAPAPKK